MKTRTILVSQDVFKFSSFGFVESLDSRVFLIAFNFDYGRTRLAMEEKSVMPRSISVSLYSYGHLELEGGLAYVKTWHH